MVLHGSTGVGKTHLLHAIALYARRLNPDRFVHLTSWNEWVRELVDALQRDRLTDFRETWSRRAVLLVDDVPMLRGREGALREFRAMVGSLVQADLRVAIALASAKRDSLGADSRASAWGDGPVMELWPPDAREQFRILERRFEGAHPQVPLKAIHEACRLKPADLRASVGMIHSMLFKSRLSSTGHWR